MRPLHSFARRNYVTLALCAVALLAFLGSGLYPASGSKAIPTLPGEEKRAWPVVPDGAAMNSIPPVGARRDPRGDALKAKLRPASMFSPFATTLTATKTDNISTPVNPGDTIMYTVEITNTGAMDATNVNFTDTIDANTTLVAGSVAVAPIAVNDAYNTIGNVNITIPVGQGVIANDLNPNGSGTLAVTLVNAVAVPGTAATTNGSVTMASDGSFTYTPNAGFSGPTDTFTYTLGNSATPGKTDTATVTITVSGRIWFVNSAAGVNGDGRLNTPFNILTGAGSADSVDAANDVIFLYTSGTNYTGGITLNSAEKIIGQGASQSILTITGFSAPSGTNLLPATGGADPVITTAGTTAITLGANNGLHGFTVGNTGAAGTDISGTSFGTLTVRDVTVNGTGRALNLATGTIASGSTFDLIESSGGSPAEGVRLNAVGGSFTSPTTNIVNPTGTGIDVQSAPSGTNFSFGGTTVNKGASVGTGVNMASNAGTFSFSSLAVTTSNGTGVSATSSGTVNVTTGSISATGGPALLSNPTTLGMTFTTVSSTNSTTTGISLTSASGSLSIGTTSITNPSGVGVSVTSSSATLNFGNTTVNDSGGTGVVLGTSGNGNTGTITFGDLDIDPDNNVRCLHAVDNTMTITATSGTINATGATAVEITRSSSTTPLAISFTRVDSSAATSGIVLTNTSGSFTVTGNGADVTLGGNGTGGTITGMTGPGVNLSNVSNISFTSMLVQSGGDDGIRGLTVTGFTLSRCSVLNNGNAVTERGLEMTNLLGTGSITNSLVTGNAEDNLYVKNGTGTLNLTTTGTTYANTSATIGNDGIQFLGADVSGSNNANMSIHVTSCVFTNNRGDHFQATTDAASAATQTIVFQNNDLNNTVGANLGAGLTLNPGGTANVTFNISNNGTVADPFTGAFVSAITINSSNNSTMSGTINNNIIGSAGVTDSGSFSGDGITVFANNTSDITVAITNNQIRQYSNLAGINIHVRDGASDTINATITGNTIANPGTFASNGILAQAGSVAGDAGFLCLDIGGAGALANSIAGSGANGGTDFRVRQRILTTVRLPGYGGANSDDAAVVSFIQGRNTGAETGSATNNVAGGGGGFVGGAACVTAANPMSVDLELTASSAQAVTDEQPANAEAADKDTLRTAPGEGPYDDNLKKLKQEELAWMVQAAVTRWAETGISAEDLTRLQAVTFEIADLPNSELAAMGGNRITIDETAAGYGWYLDQFPIEDSEFQVLVPGKELQTTDMSPAHGKMDLLTVVLRELGHVYLQGRDRIPKKVEENLRPLMEVTLSPAVRRLPLDQLRLTMPSTTGSIKPSTKANLQAQTSATTRSSSTQTSNQPVATQVEGNRAKIPAAARYAVFNPSADLMPGFYERSARLVTYTPNARSVVQSKEKPSSGETVNLNLGTIPVGEKAVIMFSVTVNNPVPANTTQVCNQGSVSADSIPSFTTDDPDVVGTNNPTCTQLNVADLAVTKTDSPDPVNAGGNITYTVNFVNNGPIAGQNVTVTDAVPANTTFVSAVVTTGSGWSTSAPSVGGTGNIVFSKATVANAETAVFTIVVKVNSNTANATVITNSATAATTTPNPTANDTGTATTTVQAQADLAVTKTGLPSPNVNAGDNITYTINFVNNGPSDAQTVTVSDAVPANTTFVSAVVTTGSGWGVSAPAVGGTGNIVFSKATVAAGETAVFTVVVNVNGNTPNATVITNNAVGASATTDPTPGNNTGTAMTTVIALADLAVTKTDTPDPVLAGNNITYTVNFVNNGPAAASTVTVTDATPANTTFVSAVVTTGSGWGISAPAVGGTGNIVFSKASVANAETAVFTIVVKVNANTASGTTITNTATAATTNSDPTPGNNSATATTTVNTEADLAVTKSDAPDPVSAGANLTYTINFVNNGPSDAQTVTVTDAVPANATFVSAVVTTGAGWSTSAPAVGGTGNVVFSKATVAAGETAVFTIVVKVNSSTASGTTISNDVTAATATTDPTSGNNTANATTTVQTRADLSVTKSDAPDPVTAGNNLTYTINFANTGPSDAQTVTIADVVPANTTFVSAVVTTGVGWAVSAPPVGGTGNIVFSKATVVAGETATFTIVVKVGASTANGVTITNSATAASATVDPTPGNNTGTSTTTVQAQADLAVTKTDLPDPVFAGNNITYTINFANNGPSDAQTVTVTDATPTNTTFVSAAVTTGSGWSTSAPAVGGTGNIVFSKATVTTGETAVFTVVVNVNSNTAAGTTITNNAVAASTTADPTPGNNTGTATTTVAAQADLAVTKSDAPDPVTAGTNLTYTINLVNNGPSDATSVTVTDAVPANTTFVSAMVTTGSGWVIAAPAVGGTGNVVFSKAMVMNGETAVFTIVVNVNANTPNGATITNSAVAAATSGDPNPKDNTATATTTVQTSADLAVTKSDSPDPVIAGNNLTYTINFVNNGPSDAQTVTVTDAVPANSTFVSASVTTGSGWGGSSPAVGGTGNVVFSKGTVAAGETAVFSIVVNVNSNTANGATITNSATAGSSTSDPTPGNNTGAATTTVQTQADLAVTKSDSPDPVFAGNNLTYTINFANNGPSDAQNVTVTDAVPAGTTFVSAVVTTGTGWAVSAPAVGGTGNVVFSKATVAAGETAVFTIVVKVNGNTANGATITNSAVAASATTDPTPGNNTGTATTTVQTQADLAVTKSDKPDPVVVTQNLTYTINFVNNGPSDAQTVTVTDAVPANTTFVSATVTSGSGWSTSSPAVGGTGNVVFSKATVAAGETAVFTIVVNVNANTPNNTIVTNSATAATATTDPNSGNNTGTASTTVIAQADLAVTKSASPNPVCVNGNLTYTINFVDNGPGPGLNTTVSDAVPANTTFVSATVTTGSGWSTSSPAVGGTGNVVFSKANVAIGETAVFTIVVKVNSGVLHGTVISNTVTAASSIPDPTPGNNMATATSTVDPIPPTITCPANITQSTDPNQCSAVVNYAAPTVTDNCPCDAGGSLIKGKTVQAFCVPVCIPASGSTFQKGTTTVTCTTSDAAGNQASCSFTVTVNDTQPPSITCPADILAKTPQAGDPCVVVTYPAPTVTDNCPGVGAVCTPPSGSCFPVGTTTVTCTATDTSGNTATCTFRITVFDLCLQDDSDPSTVVLINSFTGDYRFCCNGVTYTGRGTMTIRGSTYTLEHNAADRRVLVKDDEGAHVGSGAIQTPPGTTRCTITDRNTQNNSCACQ